MATTASKARSQQVHEQELPLTRGARVGLLVLLVLTIVFASGVLFIKYQLEAFREDVRQRIEQRFGARLSMGTISVNGLRGLRIENLKVDLPFEQGPIMHIHAPESLINIQLNDLVYGRVTVERLVLDGARIELERPEGSVWYSSEELDLDEVVPFEVTDSAPFRITGQECTVFIKNIVGDTSLDIRGFNFDIARLVDARNLTASLEGYLSGEPNKRMNATLTLASLEDFDLRVSSDLITADDINVILPADEPLVVEGAAHPTLWINGRPGRTLVVTLETPFEGLMVRDQPDFLDPASGSITVFATYMADRGELMVTSATAESNQLAGNVNGTINFGGDHPAFDLAMHARRIPITQILKYSLEGEMEDIGRMDILLDEPHELEVKLTGNSQDPVISGQTRAASGNFHFSPKDDDLPPFSLALRQIEGAWDSYTQEVSLQFDVADGEIQFEPLRLAAKGLQGHVEFKDNIVSLTPMNAQYRGNTIVGEGEYDLISGDGRVKFEGTVAGLDETVLADKFANTNLAGAVSVKGEAKKTGDKLFVEADLDATQAQVTYQWWLKKSVGLGAMGHIKAEIDPKSKAKIDFAGQIAASDITATIDLARDKKSEAGWTVNSLTAASDRLDVTAAATCAITPYRITGGTARKAFYEFTRDSVEPLKTVQRMGGVIDDLSMLPIIEGATIPVSGREVELTVELQTDKGNRSPAIGHATLNAASLHVPPFGTKWLLPLTPPPDWPRVDRAWTIDLKSAAAEVPPWKGTDLEARAFTNKQHSGFSPYKAKIDGGGTLEGSYEITRAENTYTAIVNWAGVPVSYFIDHLKFPKVLDGTITGNVNYSVDRDDPNTLAGTGHFDVRDGRFSADFLHELLEGKVESNISTVPPKLDFALLSADVIFGGDTVKTPMLRLDSDTIDVRGSGQYIRDGDMDYSLSVSVDPDTAAEIPVMAQNFNIQGHRLSNTPIDLTFHVGGPTFNPRGQVEELPPASVTLVSGALEVGREAVNLIDFPRKILVDLLKIGGGVVRGGRNRDSNENEPSQP